MGFVKVRCSIVLCIFANFIVKLRVYIFNAVFYIAISNYLNTFHRTMS